MFDPEDPEVGREAGKPVREVLGRVSRWTGGMAISVLPVLVHPLGSLQRVLLVALLAPGVLVALTAAGPALLVLPFRPGGIDRVTRLLEANTAYLRTLLINSS